MSTIPSPLHIALCTAHLQNASVFATANMPIFATANMLIFASAHLQNAVISAYIATGNMLIFATANMLIFASAHLQNAVISAYIATANRISVCVGQGLWESFGRERPNPRKGDAASSWGRLDTVNLSPLRGIPPS